MKLLYILLLLLSFNYSWAIYSIASTDSSDCVTIVINDNSEIRVVITDKDNAFTYYHLCNDNSKKEKAIRNSRIKEIIRTTTEYEVPEVIPCEKIILVNSDSINIQDSRTDSLYLYYYVCGQSKSAERKLRLSLIESRENILVEQKVVQHKSNKNKITKSNKNRLYTASARKKFQAFFGGFVIPPIVGLLTSKGNINEYFRRTIGATIALALILVLSVRDFRLKLIILAFTTFGSLLGTFIIPIVIGLLFD